MLRVVSVCLFLRFVPVGCPRSNDQPRMGRATRPSLTTDTMHTHKQHNCKSHQHVRTQTKAATNSTKATITTEATTNSTKATVTTKASTNSTKATATTKAATNSTKATITTNATTMSPGSPTLRTVRPFISLLNNKDSYISKNIREHLMMGSLHDQTCPMSLNQCQHSP